MPKMCPLRKITYGEFFEFVREKKITYNVDIIKHRLGLWSSISCGSCQNIFSAIFLPKMQMLTPDPNATYNMSSSETLISSMYPFYYGLHFSLSHFDFSRMNDNLLFLCNPYFLDRHYVWRSHDLMSGIWSIFF